MVKAPYTSLLMIQFTLNIYIYITICFNTKSLSNLGKIDLGVPLFQETIESLTNTGGIRPSGHLFLHLVVSLGTSDPRWHRTNAIAVG